MRLHPSERKTEIQGAIVALVLFCIPITGIVFYTEKTFSTKEQKLLVLEQQHNTVLEKNRTEIEEVRIIQGNQAEIDATWTLLNSWNQGAIQQETTTTLTDAGFLSVTPLLSEMENMEAGQLGLPRRPQRPGIPQKPRISQRPGMPQTYTQIEAKSTQSEFLRVISALSKIEEAEGLIQVQKLSLKLPQGTPPYQDKPTYLDVDLILATPNTIW